MNLDTQSFSSIFLALVIVCSSSFSATINAQEPSGASQFIPPVEEYDWIQLTSGEWLKGELIGLFDDKVEFDSEVLDKLYIDIDDVIGVHSRRTYSVTVRGEGVITGRIVVENGELLVDTGKGKNAVPIESLVALTASTEKRRDRWSGDINMGLNLRQGNTEWVEYSMIAGFARRTQSSRVLIDYIGSYNRTDDIETANDHRLNMTWDRFGGSRLFWRPFLGQYLRDPFQNIDHQVTLETGLGYELIRNRRTEWEIFAGAGVNYVQRKSVEEGQASSSSSPAFTLGTSLDTELTDSTDYHFSFQMTFLDEESGEYQHHLITTLSTELIGNLDLNFSFTWDRTEAPPPLADGSFAEKDDFRFITGIGFDF